MGDAGHRERQSAIPDPLAPGSLAQRLGTLGLPAAMLSWASLLALLSVLAAVQHSDHLRAAYRFFLPLPWLAALGAAALAGAVVAVGSRRPGPLWPRLWALGLAGLASVIALAALVRPAWLPTAQLHALITATLAGALALAPRLARIHPDSEWTQRVAPASLLLTLALILPPALTGAPGPAAGPNRQARPNGTDQPTLDAAIAALADTEAAVRAATDFDWSRFDLRLPKAEAVIAGLRALPRHPLARPAGGWGQGTAPARADAFTAAAQRLMDSVARGLDPARAGGLPRLSSLGLGAQNLAGPGRIVADYFEQFGRLFQALDPTPLGITTGPLPGAYAAAAADLSGFLRVIADRWSDAWSVTMIEPPPGPGLTETITPRTLLGKTLFADQGTGYRANEVARLWGLDLAAARRLQPGGRNDCGGQAFEQPGREYRIDCFAYAPVSGSGPGAKARGAAVLAELRIVYSSRTGTLSERSPPAEIWYAFAVPAGASPAERDRYQRATQDALRAALKDADLSVSGAASDQGFRIKGKGQTWKLTAPVIDHHLADRDWVVMRVLAD